MLNGAARLHVGKRMTSAARFMKKAMSVFGWWCPSHEPKALIALVVEHLSRTLMFCYATAMTDAPYPLLRPRKRWLPRLRFSLRTLVVGLLLVGSAVGLWRHWDPWSVRCRLVGHSN